MTNLSRIVLRPVVRRKVLRTVFGSYYSSPAEDLIGNEWNGFSLDFVTNTSVVRTSSGAEALLGSGPYNPEAGMGLDFIDNTLALRA